MPSNSAQTLKLKSTLRLLIPRLRNAQKKDTAVSITSRREMSVLLSQSREASARIRVENIIQTDICVELMEILELYAELLLARAGLLDTREKEKGRFGAAMAGGADGDGGGGGGDTGLEEAAAAMIYAAPRLPREVRELGIVRGMLVERFGKDFALKCSADGGAGVVPNRVVEKLKVEPPSNDLVEAYLREIARTYGVDWPRQTEEQEQQRRQLEEEVNAEDVESNVLTPNRNTAIPGPPTGMNNTQNKISASLSSPTTMNATVANKNSISPPRTLPSSPTSNPPSQTKPSTPNARSSPIISVAPPAPRSDNPSPKVKLPHDLHGGEVEGGGGSQKPTTPTAAPTSVDGGLKKAPNVDELSRRFAQLKR